MAGSYIVAGTVTVDGEVAPDDYEVDLYQRRGNFIATTSISGGAGIFSYEHDTEERVIAVYNNGGRVGCSSSGLAGTDDFSIEIGFVIETEPPTITFLSYPESATDPLTLQINDVSPLVFYQITCQDTPESKCLVVFDSNLGFLHPFDRLSSISGEGSTGDPFVFTIYRKGGWPAGLDITINAVAIDSAGNDS